MALSFRHSRSGFTLVELIVGMTIFAIGLTGIYALLSSTMGNAVYSRHEIVVANLLREQIELVKNIRDTNIRNFLPWDAAFTEGMAPSSFHSGIYIIENDFSTSNITIDGGGNIASSPVYLKDITVPFQSLATIENHFRQSGLYTDDQGRYTHKISGSGTPYASYVIITPIGFQDAGGNHIEIKKDGKPQGFLIDARVIVNSRGVYREYDAKTMITDWIR